MKNSTKIDFSVSSTEDLVSFINKALSHKKSIDLETLQVEFDRRGVDYENLVFDNAKLQLESPLKLVNSTLFETQIPLPSMVGELFPIVMNLNKFLNFHTEKLVKDLVTYDYVLSNCLLSKSAIEVIEDLNQVKENQVFVVLKFKGQQFPSLDKSLGHSTFKHYFVVEKSDRFRGLKSVSFYEDGIQVDYLDLN